MAAVGPSALVWLLLSGAAIGLSCSRSKQPGASTGSAGEGGASVAAGAAPSSAGSRAEAGRGNAGSPDQGGESSAGHSSGGAASESPYPDWLTNAAGWVPAKAAEGCTVKLARNAAQLTSGLTFASCGDGCQVSSVAPADVKTDAFAFELGVATRAVNDELDLSLSVALLGKPALTLLGTYRYGSGAPSLLMSVDSTCLAKVGGIASPRLFQIFPASGPTLFKLALFDPAKPNAVRWVAGTTPRLLDTFDYGTSWGAIENFAEAFVASNPLALDLTSIRADNGFLHSPATRPGIVAWGEWLQAEGSIVAWAEGKTAAEVASGPWFPALVGVSDERFAWLGGTGPNVTDGRYDTAKVYWCDRAESVGACQAVAGPTLPISSATGALAVHGRYVALTGCTTTDCDVYVVDTSASSVHRIERVAADRGILVLGLSATELFAADISPARRGTAQFDGVLRYDLSKLAEFSVQL